MSTLWRALTVLCMLWLGCSPAEASARTAPPTTQSAQPSDCEAGPDACPVDLGLAPAAEADDANAQQLLFFWGIGCPHCEEAKPFLDALAKRHPKVRIERIEIRQNKAGLERFIEVVRTLGIQAPGIPLFVIGRAYHIGFDPEATPAWVEATLAGTDRAHIGLERVRLPLVGSVRAADVPFPVFTALIGLVDGINPCAMWVLLVLLGILSHVKSRKRLLLFGGTFVVMSGVVYFMFMTAWVGLFQLVGLSRPITMALGAAVIVMGLINLKELVWFKKGVSLTIPERAKPKLYRRMRGIVNSASLPAALLGVTTLAFFVNLVELGCTLGLPAVYTRILTLRDGMSDLNRYAYLALYNAAYIVPLAAIVVLYAQTLHRLVLHERGAKVLKGISGALLVAFGAVLLFAPDVLA